MVISTTETADVRMERRFQKNFRSVLARDRELIARLDPEQAAIRVLTCLAEVEDRFGLPPRTSAPHCTP